MDILFPNCKLPTIHSESVPRSRSKASKIQVRKMKTGEIIWMKSTSSLGMLLSIMIEFSSHDISIPFVLQLSKGRLHGPLHRDVAKSKIKSLYPISSFKTTWHNLAYHQKRV